MDSSFQTLPLEIKETILLKVPIEYLPRCELVCREWHNIINANWRTRYANVVDVSTIGWHIGKCKGPNKWRQRVIHADAGCLIHKIINNVFDFIVTNRDRISCDISGEKIAIICDGDASSGPMILREVINSFTSPYANSYNRQVNMLLTESILPLEQVLTYSSNYAVIRKLNQRYRLINKIN